MGHFLYFVVTSNATGTRPQLGHLCPGNNSEKGDLLCESSHASVFWVDILTFEECVVIVSTDRPTAR